MQRYDIPYAALRTAGQTFATVTGEGLHVTVGHAIPTERFDRDLPIGAYVAPAQRFHLPLRIDLTARIDVPGLYILLGDGHVNFGRDWADNRRLDDPVAPRRKPCFFDSSVPMNQFVTLSLRYDLTEMQILVDGQERYHSRREPYMRSPLLAARNAEGFALRIACDKGTNLVIQRLAVTEYGPEGAGIARTGDPLPAPRTRNIDLAEGEKPTFARCIEGLPAPLREEITRMDEALRAMRPLKFRRDLERNGNKITYVAPAAGFSYALYPSGDVLHHTLQWYILTNCKPELWAQKADHMEAVLDRLAQDDPAFARRMFDSLLDCVGCGPHCRVPRTYTHAGARRIACHGKLRLTMRPEDLRAAMRFIAEVNALMIDSKEAAQA